MFWLVSATVKRSDGNGLRSSERRSTSGRTSAGSCRGTTAVVARARLVSQLTLRPTGTRRLSTESVVAAQRLPILPLGKIQCKCLVETAARRLNLGFARLDADSGEEPSRTGRWKTETDYLPTVAKGQSILECRWDKPRRLAADFRPGFVDLANPRIGRDNQRLMGQWDDGLQTTFPSDFSMHAADGAYAASPYNSARVSRVAPPGTRLGPYEITGQLGAGGMGEVYRATDTHLKRTVAIKVLPEAVATDGERLARFQREAEVLARLNHPNIAAIYGLEKRDGTAALVMELVEGPTLADRIAQGRFRSTTRCRSRRRSPRRSKRRTSRGSSIAI